MGVRILDLVAENQIALELSATTQTDALREVAELFQGHPEVTDLHAFYEEVMTREKISSTCTGNGVAFPHARTDHVKKIVGAIGRSPAGILFENGQRVHLLMMIGTPKVLVKDYLICLAAMARALRGPGVIEAAMQATTRPEFLHALSGPADAVQP